MNFKKLKKRDKLKNQIILRDVKKLKKWKGHAEKYIDYEKSLLFDGICCGSKKKIQLKKKENWCQPAVQNSRGEVPNLFMPHSNNSAWLLT